MLYSLLVCIAYILGIIWGLAYKIVGLVPIFFIIVCLIYIIKNKKYNYLSLILIFIFGFSYLTLKNNYFISKYSNSTIRGTGEIKRVISMGDYYNKY